MKSIFSLFVVSLILTSCFKSASKDNKAKSNLLVIVNKDTLEDGFWEVTSTTTGVKSFGTYSKGFKEGFWNYESPSEQKKAIEWRIIEGRGVKFNYHKPLNIDSPDERIIFSDDLDDNDPRTEIAFSRYDTAKAETNIYGYMYSYFETINSKASAEIISNEAKKFYFPRIEVFRTMTTIKRDTGVYHTLFYVFEVKGAIYELMMLSSQSQKSAINTQIFNDVFYSLVVDDIDLFSYNSDTFYREDKVEFEE